VIARRWRTAGLALGLVSGCAALGCASPTGAAPKRTPYLVPPLAGELSPAEQKREEWRRSRVRLYMDDFGELGRYRAANAALPPSSPGDQRVVFYGDSITDMWPLALSFPGKPYVNRGISGQTTSQMLVRFRQDVLALGAKVVVILAGTNDIAGNTGPMTLDETEANIASMVELGRAHGVRVVLSSVLPVHNYTREAQLAFPLRPPEKIAALNNWLKTYAAQNGCVYLDYARAMTDERGFLQRELATDGLHPNKAGYAIMAPLAEAAVAMALAPP
jgi:lysophospholipase L1-like esterase